MEVIQPYIEGAKKQLFVGFMQQNAQTCTIVK